MSNIIRKLGGKAVRIVDPYWDMHRWLRGHKNNVIEVLSFETTSYCPHECKFCNFHGDEKLIEKIGGRAFAKWEIIEELADQVKKLGTVRQLCPGHSGDEFLNPEWFEMLNCICKNMEPGGVILISTSGMLLSEDNLIKLNKLNIDKVTLQISFSGYNEAETEFFRKNQVYDTVRKNVKRAEEILDKKKCSIHFNVNQYYMKSELEKFHGRIWKIHHEAPEFLKRDFPEMLCYVGPTSIMTPDFDYGLESGFYIAEESSKGRFCPQPFNQCTVDVHGNVLICSCNGGYERLGNIMERDMYDIWSNSPRLEEARRLIRNKEMSPDYCRNCFFQLKGKYSVLAKDDTMA